MSDVKHTEERTETHSCDNERTETHDLISRKAAIDGLNEVIFDEKITGFDAISTILDLPSAEPERHGRWIPCGERLPEDYQDVLVWFEYFRYGDYNRMYSTYGIGNYSNQYDSWLINHETGWTDLHVFAWMPMPKPYEEGDNE